MRATNYAVLPTPRELEVMQHTAAGLTDRQTAAALCVETVTVSTHWRNLRRKYGGTRTRAVVLAMQRGDLVVEGEA